MSKYFDNTFFKFLFGFLVILALSFLFLYVTDRLDKNRLPDGTSTYVEASVE